MSESIYNLNSTFIEIARQYADFSKMLQPQLVKIAKQQASFHKSIKPYLNQSNEMNKSIQQTLKLMPPYIEEISKQQKKFVKSITPSLNNIAKQQALIVQNINKSGLSDVYNQLRKIDISEIVIAIDDYNNNYQPKEGISDLNATLTVRSKNTVGDLTLEELNEMIDKKISTADKTKPGFLKSILRDILVNVGTDAVKWMMQALFAVIFIISSQTVQENHLTMINDIQKHIPEAIVTVGYLEAKKFIESEGLSEYEYINKVGIIRVDTIIREGKTKNALAIKEIKINTVVNILEKKGNWIKIQLPINNEYIEGWVEESTVLKFKKAN